MQLKSKDNDWHKAQLETVVPESIDMQFQYIVILPVLLFTLISLGFLNFKTVGMNSMNITSLSFIFGVSNELNENFLP